MANIKNNSVHRKLFFKNSEIKVTIQSFSIQILRTKATKNPQISDLFRLIILTFFLEFRFVFKHFDFFLRIHIF